MDTELLEKLAFTVLLLLPPLLGSLPGEGEGEGEGVGAGLGDGVGVPPGFPALPELPEPARLNTKTVLPPDTSWVYVISPV
jgi:hypothetical protein